MILISTDHGTPVFYKSFLFSGGEVQVRLYLPSDATNFFVEARVTSPQEFMELVMMLNAINSNVPNAKIHISMPYLPYARQDRVCVPGEAFALEAIATIFNSIKYTTLSVWDVHSPVALDLFNKIENFTADNFVKRIKLSSTPIVVAPDMGAVERATLCANVLNTSTILAEKLRDPNDGKILKTVIHAGHVGDTDLLMVDDICDGGRTFIELAKVARTITTGKIMLYVTHGIFSQGLEVFDGLVDEIYCPNIWPNVSGPILCPI